mmetsp:Transcript_44954/g.70481  ORF Transcript_44954/g.70481 Transcript_44954/m.70481 type:complete len:391 (+) Transcript_44954:1753-2925(+)
MLSVPSSCVTLQRPQSVHGGLLAAKSFHHVCFTNPLRLLVEPVRLDHPLALSRHEGSFGIDAPMPAFEDPGTLASLGAQKLEEIGDLIRGQHVVHVGVHPCEVVLRHVHQCCFESTDHTVSVHIHQMNEGLCVGFAHLIKFPSSTIEDVINVVKLIFHAHDGPTTPRVVVLLTNAIGHHSLVQGHHAILVGIGETDVDCSGLAHIHVTDSVVCIIEEHKHEEVALIERAHLAVLHEEGLIHVSGELHHFARLHHHGSLELGVVDHHVHVSTVIHHDKTLRVASGNHSREAISAVQTAIGGHACNLTHAVHRHTSTVASRGTEAHRLRNHRWGHACLCQAVRRAAVDIHRAGIIHHPGEHADFALVSRHILACALRRHHIRAHNLSSNPGA